MVGTVRLKLVVHVVVQMVVQMREASDSVAPSSCLSINCKKRDLDLIISLQDVKSILCVKLVLVAHPPSTSLKAHSEL